MEIHEIRYFLAVCQALNFTRAAESRHVTQPARFLKLEAADLRLGVIPTIGPMRFVGFRSRFRTDHPGIALMLSERIPCLVTVAGRRWSSPLAGFIAAIRRYRWPDAQAEGTA